jgi:hypothetical protein
MEGLEDRHMPVFLSPDAFARRDSPNTQAWQFSNGLERVFGKESAFVADLTDAEKGMKAEDAMRSMEMRRRDHQGRRFTIQRASHERIAGWMHIHNLMRWEPFIKEQTPDMGFAKKLYDEKGLVAYTEYVNAPEFKRSAEILPRLLISSEIPELIKSLAGLVHREGTEDVDKVDGDDYPDSLRYGLYSADVQPEAMTPIGKRVDDRVAAMKEQYPGMHPHTIAMVEQAAWRTERGGESGSFPVGRNRMEIRRLLASETTRVQ